MSVDDETYLGRRQDGKVHVHRYGPGARQQAPRRSPCPGKAWKCDAGCGAGLARDGVIRHTCPKAHVHRVCTNCCIGVLAKIVVELNVIEGGGTDKNGQEYGPLIRMSRCPFTITDADRAMAALIEPSA